MPVNIKHGLLFVHIPKTGGSTIEKMIGVYGLDNNGSIKLSKKIMYGVTKEGKAIHHLTYSELIHENAKLSFLTSFSVVRNPYDRMVSEYSWRLKEKILPIDTSFEGFLNHYIVKKETLSEEDHHYSDHLIPQSEFVFDKSGGVVDHLFKYEEFDQVIAFLKTKLSNKDFEYEHLNMTRHNHYRSFYNQASKEIIANNYNVDFQNFNYEI